MQPEKNINEKLDLHISNAIETLRTIQNRMQRQFYLAFILILNSLAIELLLELEDGAKIEFIGLSFDPDTAAIISWFSAGVFILIRSLYLFNARLIYVKINKLHRVTLW